MISGTAARLFALIALGAALLVAALVPRGEETGGSAPGRAARPGPDAPASGLARCRDLGTAALEDTVCRTLWREHRDRFLEKGEHGAGGSGAEPPRGASEPPAGRSPAPAP